MDHRNQTFDGKDVVLDNNAFYGCTFRNCRIIFRATGPCTLDSNRFMENVRWVLEGPALLTVQFLAALHQGAGEGGRDLVENTLKQITAKRH